MGMAAILDDDEFRFNDASTHEGHLRQNCELTWFCNETIIMISQQPFWSTDHDHFSNLSFPCPKAAPNEI